MNKGKKFYFILLILITILVSTVYFSYAFFMSRNEEHGKLNIVAGTLDYKIESSDLEDNQITLAAGETKEIKIKITSLNSVDSKYELYYTLDNENTDVEVGYSSDTVDNVSGTISANGTKEVTVVLINSSDTSSTVTFDVLGGLIGNELALNNGNSLNQELSSCSYSLGTEFTFDYSGSVEEFVVPCSGTYKLEVYGAQGGAATYSSTYNGGLGGYSNGLYAAKKSQTLFVAVGGMGKSYSANASSTSSVDNGLGYNGGGIGSVFSGNSAQGGGGGATHIALGSTNRGELYNYENYKSELLIVAGGGGGASSHINATSWSGTGGTGGGLTGGNPVPASSSTYCNASGGTQTSGGLQTKNTSVNPSISCTVHASFGQGSGFNGTNNGALSGGGGGYYGGAGGWHGPAAGGSGYIGGVTDGSTENGVRSGNGYAKITYIDKYAYSDSVTITKVSVNNEEASKVSEEEYDYYYSIGAGSIELNIEVETFNPDATVEITTLDGDALTTPFPINAGDNLLKIKVTSESQEKSEEYILNIEGLTCPYSPNTEFTFAYSRNVEEFVVPCSGTYKLEVWGAQGGSSTGSSGNGSGGKGGYSFGTVYLSETTSVFVAVGGQGTAGKSSTNPVGGYNGGGNAKSDGSSSGWTGAGGGGATHIGLKNMVLSDYGGTDDLYIVAGGGGGAASIDSVCTGGAGGGVSGGNSSGSAYNVTKGGSQSAGGTGYSIYDTNATATGRFGQGGHAVNYIGGAGGGGLYGGGGAGYGCGAGGSGYIGGVTGGSTSNGIQSGNGKATITYLGP